MKTSQSNYEHNVEMLDQTINFIAPVLHNEFSNIGAIFKKVTNRGEKHPNAHVFWEPGAGKDTQTARVSSSVSIEYVETINGKKIFEPTIRLYQTNDKYKILGKVDYLIAFSCPPSATKRAEIIIIDSKKLVHNISTLLDAGNDKLALEGIAAYGDYIPVSLTQLNKWNLVYRHLFYYPEANTYEDQNHKISRIDPKLVGLYEKYKIPGSIQEARPIHIVYKDTYEDKEYDSIGKCAIDLFGIKYEDSNFLTRVAAISNVVNNRAKKSKDKDGKWFTVFDSDKWIKLGQNKELKQAITERFAKATRINKVKDI